MGQFGSQSSQSPPTYGSTLSGNSSTPIPCARCSNQALPGPTLPPKEDLNQVLPGWPSLAKLVNEKPDFEAFQSFKDLNIKMLLYYQGELHYLRMMLHEQEWEDSTTRSRIADCEDDALNLRIEQILRSKGHKEPEARRQYDLIIQIRELLEKYNNALIQYSQITALPKAEPLNVRSMRIWIENNQDTLKVMGPGSESWGSIDRWNTDPQVEPSSRLLFMQFLGIMLRLFWPRKDEEEEDKLNLITPRRVQKEDKLARWVGTELAPFVENFRRWWRKEHKILPPDIEKAISAVLPWHHHTSQEPVCPCKKNSVPPSTLNTYSERRILHFTSGVSIVIACALPIAAITVLSKIHGDGELLGTIAIFTVAFAGGLIFVGGGTRRVDIFTATAAFSAVMVVFVQNQNQVGGSCQGCPVT